MLAEISESLVEGRAAGEPGVCTDSRIGDGTGGPIQAVPLLPCSLLLP